MMITSGGQRAGPLRVSLLAPATRGRGGACQIEAPEIAEAPNAVDRQVVHLGQRVLGVLAAVVRIPPDPVNAVMEMPRVAAEVSTDRSRDANPPGEVEPHDHVRSKEARRATAR